MSSIEVIRILRRDGWKLKAVKGDHYQYVHPTKKGKVTVPHPKKDIPIRTLKNIEKQAGLKFN